MLPEWVCPSLIVKEPEPGDNQTEFLLQVPLNGACNRFALIWNFCRHRLKKGFCPEADSSYRQVINYFLGRKDQTCLELNNLQYVQSQFLGEAWRDWSEVFWVELFLMITLLLECLTSLSHDNTVNREGDVVMLQKAQLPSAAHSFGCDSRFVASRGQPLLPWVCTVLCKNVEFGSKERLESLRVMLIRCPHVAGANGCGCRMRHYCCILLEPICHIYPYLYIHIYPYLSIYTYLCIYLSIHLFIYLPIYLPTYLWNILRTLNADLWFGLSCWGAFFWILSFFCSKSLASDDCCIGGFSLAGPNRSVRTSPLASSLSLVYCYTSDCFSVYIYILLLLLLLLYIIIIIIIIIIIMNFYLLNGYIYIYMYKYVRVIDSIPERSSVLTVGQPFRCSDSVTIEAAMEWECIYCNGWIWEYRIWNIICNSHGISWHIIIRYHKTREYNGIPYMIFQTISKSNPTYIYI